MHWKEAHKETVGAAIAMSGEPLEILRSIGAIVVWIMAGSVLTVFAKG